MASSAETPPVQYTAIQHAELAGDVAAVVAFVRSSSDAVDVVTLASQVLRKMVHGRRGAVGEAGGVEALVGAMERHAGDAALQNSCLQALQPLIDHAANLEAFVRCGGASWVIQAMQKHSAVGNVLANGCGVFWVLGHTDRGRQHALEAGALDIVAAAVTQPTFQPMEVGQRDPFRYKLRIAECALGRLQQSADV